MHKHIWLEVFFRAFTLPFQVFRSEKEWEIGDFKYTRKNTHRTLWCWRCTLKNYTQFFFRSYKCTEIWTFLSVCYCCCCCWWCTSYVLVWCLSFQHLHSLHTPHFVGSNSFPLSLAPSNRRYFMARYVFIVIFFGCFVFIRRAAPSRAVKFHFHSLYLLFVFFFVFGVCCCHKFSLSRCLSFICCWLFSAVCKKIHLHDHVNWRQ